MCAFLAGDLLPPEMTQCHSYVITMTACETRIIPHLCVLAFVACLELAIRVGVFLRLKVTCLWARQAVCEGTLTRSAPLAEWAGGFCVFR